MAVALADKLDTLMGFWSIEEKPTGSRDPYALRRAALGVIRIIVENELTFPLNVEADLLAFFHDRLKVMLRDKGARYDLVDAVISGRSDDFLEITRRVEALSALLGGEAGQSLLAGYKRGANILAAEEKKDKATYGGRIDTSLLALEEEMTLARAVAETASNVSTHVSDNDYAGAIETLATLREPVDAFFDKVLVNDPDRGCPRQPAKPPGPAPRHHASGRRFLQSCRIVGQDAIWDSRIRQLEAIPKRLNMHADSIRVRGLIGLVNHARKN